MPTTIKDECAIVGIGQTEFSKLSNRSELQLACECVKAAIDDAGLKPSDIEGTSTFCLDTSDEIAIARNVGMRDLKVFSRIPHGGGGATSLVHQGVMAITTGMCKAFVGYRALNGRSGLRYSSGVGEGPVTADLIHWGWYMPSGFMTPASWVAMYTQRYMYQYGVKNADCLAEIAVTTRKHAVNNPNAIFYNRPLTREEYYASRWIVEPFRLYDCCLETDGGCAFVITSTERAKDLPHPPAVIRGVAQGSAYDQECMTSFYRKDISYLPEYDLVADQIYAQSGLGPNDIDAAVIYDAFTSIVLFQLESLKFCKRGEAHEWVKDGALGLNGRLPCNTNGGQLSEAYIHGINGVNEGVRLIRGTSVNQPKKNDHVLVTSGVGVPTSAMILGKLN
jgi:acetyl-CoA acetyltransferase